MASQASGTDREPAGADLGQEGDAEGRPLGRVERVHVAAVDVGLDLPPERVARAAARDAHLLDRHAHLADQLEAVAHGEGRPFEQAADHVGAAVADGQADPGPLGVGVEVGRSLAGQVGQEEQPLGARAGQGGLVGQQEIGIFALLLGQRDLGLAQLVAEPLEAAAGRQHDAHDVPGARHGVAAALEPAQRVEAERIGMGEHDARGPHRRRDDPLPDDAVADRAGRLVAAAADDRRAHRQARRLRSQLAHLRRDLRALVAGGQERRIDVELAQQLAAPAAVGHVEQERARGVAHLGRVRAGQPVADIILGQEHLAHPLPVLRLVRCAPRGSWGP